MSFAQAQIVPNAYPVATNEFVAASEALTALAAGTAENLDLLGRAGGSFFMGEVLRDIYDRLGGGEKKDGV